MRQIDTNLFRIISPVKYGCAILSGIEDLPTYEVVLTNGASELGLTLWGEAPQPWNDISLVSIQMFRQPEAEAAFQKTYAWFGNDRKPKARLPERRPVAPTDLALANLIGPWDHESFAISGRDLFHVYRTPKIAVIIRLMARSGTMLDHPLLGAAAANLTLDDRIWSEEMPEMEPTGVASRRARDLDSSGLAVLEKERKAYRKLLGIGANSSPDQVVERIHAQLKKHEVMPLAVAWADALCAKAGWQWMVVDDDYVIASPDHAFSIDPFAVIETSKKKSSELLLFNMVSGGDLPPSSPAALVSLT